MRRVKACAWCCQSFESSGCRQCCSEKCTRKLGKLRFYEAHKEAGNLIGNPDNPESLSNSLRREFDSHRET